MNYDRIKEQREKTGLSARKFAEALDIKYTTYYGYETGVREPNSEAIVKMCSYFGCTADYLLGRVDDPHKMYGEEEKENSPTPDGTGAGEFTLEQTDRLLVALGLIEEGGQLSDDDLTFVSHIVGLLRAWFRKGK